jgi:O-antigen/teichoic acid export membrane protein
MATPTVDEAPEEGRPVAPARPGSRRAGRSSLDSGRAMHAREGEGRPLAEPAAALGAMPPAPARPSLAQLGRRLASSAVARRAAAGAVWSVSGAIAARVLALLAAIGVARQLGAAAFGEYNLVLNTAGMIQAFAGFGLGETTTRYLSGRYRGDPEAAGRVIALSAFAAAAVGAVEASLLVALAPWIARDLLGAPSLGGPLRFGAVLLLVGPVNGALLGVLTGLERFRLVAVVSIASAAASIPLLVLGARAGGMAGGVVGQVLSTVVGAGFAAAAVRIATRAAGSGARFRGALREWRILLSYSLPATLSNLLVAPVTWVTSALVANQPDGLRELGLFSAANQWRNAIVLVATSTGAVLFPLFSRLSDSGRSRDFSRAFWTSFAAVGAACAAMAAVLGALAPTLMAAYGAEFGGATQVLVLLALAGAIAGPLNVVGQAIAGAGRMWLSLSLNLGWACALLVTAHLLRSRGALGLSVAHVVAFLVYLVISLGCASLLVLRAPRGPHAEG